MSIDEYDIYSRLDAWGYDHESVCHSAGEYARDDDGDGFCEVHVNTMCTWPDESVHIWEALSPHLSCTRKQLKILA
jgi:hypothetical protein